MLIEVHGPGPSSLPLSSGVEWMFENRTPRQSHLQVEIQVENIPHTLKPGSLPA